MVKRVDKLQIDLPNDVEPDPIAAAAVQELLGGKFGEMSTFMNYTYQSFNMRGREEIRPFYDLVASITAEEFGHIELVSATINLLLNGSTPADAKPDEAPLKEAVSGPGNKHHFLNNGNSALVVDAMDRPWDGNNVFSSGNLTLDMLHNFFLESGARMGKLRAYESSDNPVVRRLTGYLLVRGGVHQLAYTVALQKLTGVEVPKMLPIPDIPNHKIPETREFEAKGLHRTLYRFSDEEYKYIGAVFNGTHPEDGQPLTITEGIPTGASLADLKIAPSSGIPAYDMDELREITKRLMRDM